MQLLEKYPKPEKCGAKDLCTHNPSNVAINQ